MGHKQTITARLRKVPLFFRYWTFRPQAARGMARNSFALAIAQAIS
jgi:hypothetical protein